MSKHIDETAAQVLAKRLGIRRDELDVVERANELATVRKEVELVLASQPAMNPENMLISNGWLVVDTNECGCGGGGSDMGYGHMPMCNYHPYFDLTDVLKRSGYVLASEATL